jgi:phytoene desaturase
VAHHNLYFSHPWEEHFEAIFDRPRWPERPSYYVSCASFDDERVAPEGHENVFFLVPVAPGLEDSDEIRERYAEKVLDHFERLTGENIRDHILIRRLYSHRDFSRDYNAFRGSALGLSHTLSQTAVFRPSHRSKRVKNLYYSGQYTHPGVGVPMTFISADVVTDEIVKEYA